MLTYRTLTTNQYIDEVVNLISGTEGHLQNVKNIGDGKATIGYGYTFNRNNNVSIWRATGITLTAGEWAILEQIDSTKSSTQKTAIALNQFNKSLTFTGAKALLEQTYQEYESPAIGLAMPESWERVAFVSVTYNRGEPAVQSKMQAFYLAIATSDRAEAWFQIRYNSQTPNPLYKNGIAKRRYYEAEIFGLYNDPANVTEVEAKQVLQMYTRHHQAITAYEALYGVGIDGRVEYRNTIAEANKDFSLSGNSEVDTLTEALKPAKDVLIDRYVSQENINVTINGEVLVGDYGLNLYDHLTGRDETRPPIPEASQASNDLLIGGMGIDELKGLDGDDVLYGEDGNDILEGGKGNDILVGGKGFDTYIWNTGDGSDTIIDEDQQGVIIINEGSPNSLVAEGAFIETFLDSKIWTQIMADGSVLTLSNQSSWRLMTADGSEIILGNDWQNGDFGIHIDNFNSPADIGLTITGDFSPIDFALTTDGIQTQTDGLGNIKTDSNKPEVNRADTLYDSTGNDRLQGLGGQDVLDAKRGGDDILEGGADSDVLLGGAGEDRLFGNIEQTITALLAAGETGTGTGQRGDLLAGGLGNDKLYGSNGNDALAGGDGADTLVGGLGNDVLLGDDNFISAGTNWNVTQQHQSDGQGGVSHRFVVVGAEYQHLTQGGDDLIYGGAGADLVFAGFGNDTINAGSDNDVVFGDAGHDVIQGQGGNDILIGDGYGDVPYGNDYIFGGDGNDWLYGTGGDDYLDGGAGDDVLLGDHNGGSINTDGEDSLNGGSGNDFLFGGGKDDYLSGNSGNDTLYGEDGNDILDGNEDDDTLYGGDGADILDGGTGTNKLFGQGGNDTLFGGLGDDILSGDEGDDTYIINGSANARIQDYVGNNTLLIATAALTGSYTLSTDSQTGNVFIANPDASSIVIDKALFGTELTISSDDGELDILSLREWVGANFNSSVNFIVQTENGSLYGGNASDRLAGLSGNNTLWGGGGGDDITGNGGDDTLYGDTGNDRLFGGDGNDTLIGGSDDDILDGGASDDILKGNEGKDSYVLKAGNTGLDTVWEQDGESSTIKLEGMDFADLTAQQDGSNLMLSGLASNQGLVLKDYFIQTHDWTVMDYRGEERQLSEVISENNARRSMLDQVAWLEDEFITNWRTEMAGDLLAANAIQLADGRFEQKPVVNFHYNQTTHTPSNVSPSTEYEWFETPYWTTTSLVIKTLGIEELADIGSYFWGWENSNTYSLQDVKLDKWTINQSSQDYDQYSYQWVFKSELYTFPPGVSGISIPDSYNLRYFPTDEPGTYLLTWQEYQKTLNYHAHSIDIDGQANVVSAVATTDDQQITASSLGHQVLDGQTLPDHFVLGIEMQEVLLNAVQVEGSESDDTITFGSDYALIIHAKGGDDAINSQFINEGPIAKGFLDGGDGNDTIVGGYNDDILIGGNGSDYLQGGAGADRYVLSGDGIDLINPWQGGNWGPEENIDVIELPEGIRPEMVTTQYGTVYFDNRQIRNESVTLNLNWLGQTQVMVVLPFTLPNYNNGRKTFDAVVLNFADGTSISMETLLANAEAADSGPSIWSASISSNNEGVEWNIPLKVAEFMVGMGDVSVSDYAGGIEFSENILPDEVRYLKSGDDLLVRLISGSDSLRLKHWYKRIDAPEARFSDGQVWTYDLLYNEGIKLTGTAGNDYLAASDNYGWRLLGLSGDDVLQGNDGADYLEGDEGNDTLIGGMGDDDIDGGSGNDKLLGGAGSDYYYFGRGSGFDMISDQTVSDSGDINTVVIDNEVLPENVLVHKDQNHIILSIDGTDDKLTIQWDKYNGYGVQQVEFSDGTVWDAVMLESRAIPFNTAPRLINPLTQQNGIENHPFSFQISADTFLDNDLGDVLNYSVRLDNGSPLPDWLNFNPATRTFFATPGLNDAGTLSLIVTATDKGGLSSSSEFNLNIANFIEGTIHNDKLVGSVGNDFILAGAGSDIVDGRDGNDVIVGGAGSDVLNGGAGDDIFLVEGKYSGFDQFEGGSGFDTIQGGANNDIIRVKNFHGINTVEKIDGGLGINSLVGTRYNDIIDLSATTLVNINSIEGRAGNDKIIGSSSADRLDGGTGKDNLTGGAGDDTYILGRGYGVDTVIDKDTTTGNTDVVQFLASITADQIWFKHIRNNLEVSIIGTADKLVIKDWYQDTANHVEQFKTADSRMLLDNQVETLVSAMASFAPPAAGQTTLPTDYQRTLNSVIAANWQ